MPRATFTLFDFEDPEHPKPPLNAVIEYEDVQDPLAYGERKVTIGVGDAHCCGTISIPMDILTRLISAVLDKEEQRNKILLMPTGLIKPN